MDSDIEISDDEIFDDDHDFFDEPPFPRECENEVKGIETLSKCFIRRHNSCPVFFMGSLQEACESAFNSTVVDERCPILVYIHHEKSPLCRKFCSNIFCSEKIIEYLLNNYIVWAWDFTYESNKNRLMEIWEKMFSSELFYEFAMEQYPLLIGIMRRSAGIKGWSSPSDYECTLLHQGDTLTRIKMESNRERLLNELIIFKKQCDDNEQTLSFDFIQKTGLCPEILLEITQYLLLDDIVNAFSPDILPFLNKYNARLHLSNPSNVFTNMILQKIKSKQVVSVRLTHNYDWLPIELAHLSIFHNIISLTLVNLQHIRQIDEFRKAFPNVKCLSLWFDNEVSSQTMANILQQVQHLFTRLKIHCAEPICTYQPYLEWSRDTTIEYFQLDVGHFPLNLMNSDLQDYNINFFITTINCIKYMNNIRYVHLIINNYSLQKFLDVNEWKDLAQKCHRLTKITLQVTGYILKDEKLIQKVGNIQKGLCEIRKKSKFQLFCI